ncbi:MAG: pyroglutamyl-peptidase I [Mycoplasmatales bacterium]
MKVLITGFDPFGGENINPAYEAVKDLPNEINGSEIIKYEVPTVFRKSITTLIAAMNEHQPDIVICVGQAGGRFEVTPERVAINIDDARIPDNEGNQPFNQPIEVDGESAYFSNLPVKAMVKEMQSQNIPASLSNTAGTYVCNHILYGLMHEIKVNPKFSDVRGGFIHVPFLPQQVIGKAGLASMSKENITKGLYCAIKAALENFDDVHLVTGKND